MNRLRRSLPYLGIALFVLVFALPVVWMVGAAFEDPARAGRGFLPTAPTLDNIRAVLADGFLVRLKNTAIVAFGATLLSLVAGFLAAYALARFRFPKRLDVLFLLLVLVVKLMPPIVVALPLHALLLDLGLLGTLSGLVLVYQLYTLPFCLWMLLGFVREVPVEIEAAAAIDGAGLGRRLWHIVLPLALPGLVATLIFALILCWNEFLFALLYLQRPSRFTLPLYVATFITEDETLWGRLMAIGLLSSLPVLLVAGYIQKHLLRGFAPGTK